MESDFSVRNEVDSISPPQGDNFNYSHQNSPYDDIVSSINNAPPFPSAPLAQDADLSPYFVLMSQQLRQQQAINNKLIERLTQPDPIPWKYLTLILGAAVLFLMLQKPYSARKNPKVIYVDSPNDD